MPSIYPSDQQKIIKKRLVKKKKEKFNTFKKYLSTRGKRLDARLRLNRNGHSLEGFVMCLSCVEYVAQCNLGTI